MPTLLAFPAYRDNPFLTLLHGATSDAGWVVQDAVTLTDLERTVPRLGAGDVVHANWTSQVSQAARTGLGARRDVRRFRAVLDDLRERGVGILWTVHNLSSHDARHASADEAVYRLLAERADVTHVMNRATPDLAAAEGLELQRVRVVPHPSYLGAYPQAADRAAARARLGLPGEATGALLFGHLKPYKGALDFVRGVAAAHGSGAAVAALIAGRGARGEWASIRGALPAGLPVATQESYVDAASAAEWFGAADVLVAPYRRILNSGSVMLAATFGVPVLVPDEPALVAEYGDEPWVVTFDRAAPAEAIGAMLGGGTDWDALGRTAAEAAWRLRPEAIAPRFVELVSEAASG